ncbi:MAG: PhoH family protein [Bacteroidota bacterium]
MNEKIIQLESIEPLDLYGINDQNLELIKKYVPKLKIIARGDTIKAIGTEHDIDCFIEKLEIFVGNIHKNGALTIKDITSIMEIESEIISNNEETSYDKNILLYGRNGNIIKARTTNQQKMVDSFNDNDMIFAIGPAGSGKTYTAVALAVRALKNKEVKKIILTRPAVEAGENLGFLPGDLKDKLDPYLQPLYDALNDMIPATKLKTYMEEGIIQIAPLAFMRGRTLDNAFAILDEAQNATQSQLKMFLTRMGKNAKFVITGDLTQIDLPRNQQSGLKQATQILKNIKGIEIIELDEKDIVRHDIVVKIVEAYKNNTTPLVS